MSFVSSKGNILCRLIKIELYKIFAIINRAIKGLHCTCWKPGSISLCVVMKYHYVILAVEASSVISRNN